MNRVAKIAVIEEPKRRKFHDRAGDRVRWWQLCKRALLGHYRIYAWRRTFVCQLYASLYQSGENSSGIPATCSMNRDMMKSARTIATMLFVHCR